jgi:methylenetetrahydrofolate reductase (NADPH)
VRLSHELKDTERMTVANLLRSYSIETTPMEKTVPGNIAPGTHVYVASVPRADKRQIVGRAAQLRKAGLVPVPHVAARGIESAAALRDFLVRLRDEADVESALVLGGDTDKPVGPFASSRAILETGLFADLGFKIVGFATYAEDHPSIARDVLDRELAAKLAEAARQGLQATIVSQFCFEPDILAAHVARLRELDPVVPIRLGVAGPASVASLARFALLCGVRNSARFLARRSGVGRLLASHDPTEIVTDLADALAARGGLDPVALHIFSFGGMQKAVDWAAASLVHNSVAAS